MDITKREKIGLAVFVVIILTVISISYFKGTSKDTVKVIEGSKAPNNTKVEDKNVTTNSSKEICVYISGEVNKPGIYNLTEGDRIAKLVELAGGFTNKADAAAINLAMKLKDEDYIFVREKAEEGIIGSSSMVPSQNGINDKVNINTATAEQLKTLDGIGDTLAQRIIDYRTNNGYFKDIKDINNVSGIGDAKFNSIKDKITVH